MRLYDFRHKTTNLFEREVIIFQRFCRWNVVIDFTSKVGFCKAAYCEKYLSGAERGIHSHSINKIMHSYDSTKYFSVQLNQFGSFVYW